MGILMRGAGAVHEVRDGLLTALADASPHVRVIAAQALGEFGSAGDLSKALPLLLEMARLDNNGVYVSMLALNALDALNGKAKGAKETIAHLPQKDERVDPKLASYVPRLIEKTLADLN
jgi:uncharacterized sulfatase